MVVDTQIVRNFVLLLFWVGTSGRTLWSLTPSDPYMVVGVECCRNIRKDIVVVDTTIVHSRSEFHPTEVGTPGRSLRSLTLEES